MSLNKAIRRATVFAAAALLVTAVSIKPVAVYAMGSETPPPADDAKKKKKDNKAIEQQEQQLAHEKFLRGYRAARDAILAGDYKGGIAAMHALGQDEHPDVANYIGYASRKLGNYEDAKYWYEKALAADPKHVRTYQYFAMWHLEQGNRLKAQDYLATIRTLCGDEACKEYVSLQDALSGNMVY